MDMNISGSGTVPAGEYENIKISGSGHMKGSVKCASLYVSGSADAESVVCAGEIRVSGACSFEGDVHSKTIHVSGACNFEGNATVAESFHLSGGVNMDGNLKCGTLDVHGGLRADGDIEAETVSVRGNIFSEGLLNAEQIDINTKSGCALGSIGCGKLTATYTKRKWFANLINVTYNGRQIRGVMVEQSIEGDEIDIKYVTCPRVSGRTVKIGEGCEIEVLQYSESCEIDPKAKVVKIEKI